MRDWGMEWRARMGWDGYLYTCNMYTSTNENIRANAHMMKKCKIRLIQTTFSHFFILPSHSISPTSPYLIPSPFYVPSTSSVPSQASLIQSPSSTHPNSLLPHCPPPIHHINPLQASHHPTSVPPPTPLLCFFPFTLPFPLTITSPPLHSP